MTSVVNMPRDDAAINIDTKAVAKRNVKPAEPYPATPPVKEHEGGHVAVPPVKPRQRRQGDRRQRDEPVLLDTRNGRDRRKSGEQDGDDDTQTGHIDVYI